MNVVVVVIVGVVVAAVIVALESCLFGWDTHLEVEIPLIPIHPERFEHLLPATQRLNTVCDLFRQETLHLLSAIYWLIVQICLAAKRSTYSALFTGSLCRSV